MSDARMRGNCLLEAAEEPSPSVVETMRRDASDLIARQDADRLARRDPGAGRRRRHRHRGAR